MYFSFVFVYQIACCNGLHKLATLNVRPLFYKTCFSFALIVTIIHLVAGGHAVNTTRVKQRLIQAFRVVYDVFFWLWMKADLKKNSVFFFCHGGNMLRI